MTAETKQTGAAGHEAGTDEPEPVSRAVSKPALGAVPTAKRGGIYTMNAQEGVDASDLVNAAFGRKSVGKLTPRRLEIFAPDGPSTAGGKRAKQTIRLVPLNGDTGPVMCGFLDVAQKLVELRSYDTLTQQYEQRFGVPCDITAEEYLTLCRDLQMVLTPFRYSFNQESERNAGAAQAVVHKARNNSSLPAAGNSQRFNVIVLGVFVAIAAAVALTMLR